MVVLLLVLLQLMKNLAADMEPESSEDYKGGEITGQRGYFTRQSTM
jgi:hypothetical protein